jgi:hypothetical protein
MWLRAPTCALLLALTGCASVQRVQLLSERVSLPDGRFVGPIEVKVPSHAERNGHDFEVVVRVVARCDPLFTLAFPDGEQQKLGLEDPSWQRLLRLRAGLTAETTPSFAPPPPPPPRPVAAPVQLEPSAQPWGPPPPPKVPAPPQPPPPSRTAQAPARLEPEPDPVPSRGEAGAALDAELRIPAPTVGRWERTLTERWEGQLEFEAQRERRCGQAREFSVRYRNAFDETSTVALWAEVPQEVLGGELLVELFELVPPKVEPPPREPVVEAKVHVQAKVEPRRPRPPQPAPRVERPAPAVDPGARWQAGAWYWVEGHGEWVWQPGYWLAPASAPALKVESPGAPPVAGCTWVPGRWRWVPYDGSWQWIPGRWAAPPPLEEERGEPPDPTSSWEAGKWLEVNATFIWRPGRWSRPQPRAETRPPAPRPGAVWIPGEWVLVQGRWVWSPGFWTGTEQPPPPKPEVVPPRPHPDAVWLAGFWRWDATSRTHVWIDGRWELPPGEGYVWVEEKLGPDLILRGRWELKVRR